MASLGFWNLIIMAAVALVLRQCWKWNDEDKKLKQNSQFLKHPFIQKIIHLFQNPVIKILLQVVVILIVTRWLIYTGWVAYRLTQPNASFWDFKQFYIVGHLSLQHLNPYDLTIYANAQCQLLKECYAGAFIYPPNIIPLISLLGYFSIEGASTIWVFLHLVSIGFLLWGATLLMKSKSRATKTICIIICALIYGVVFCLRVGNVSSIVANLIIWSIIFARRNQNIAAGIVLGISTIKPTMSILFLLYFLLKRRWNILSACIVVSSALLLIGLWFTGDSAIEFLKLYKMSSDWTFQNHPSGNPFTAPALIDLGVIGPRLLPNYPTVAKLLSSFLSLAVFFLLCQFLYKKQVINNWNQKIYLSEVALIGCSSILLFYSQRQNTSILILAVVFLLNHLFWEIKYSKFSRRVMSLWSLGIICLLLQTGMIYFWLLEPLETPWKNGNVSYLIKVTIGTLPNYIILVLTGVILLLARRQLFSNSENEKISNQ